MIVTEVPEPATGQRSYVGALDGLRAIAVAAVVVFHFAPTVLPAGFLGVDVFFVVSGFLIARLVTREIDRTGTVSFAGFWSRRARRLLPALATVTVAVLIAAAVSFSNTEIHDLRAQALGTLFYCANWVLIFAKSNYFTNLGRPSPFLHMWTLAVEEQFYVVLPIVLFAARRVVVRHPVRAAGVALVGACRVDRVDGRARLADRRPVARRTSGATRMRWACSWASRSASWPASARRGTRSRSGCARTGGQSWSHRGPQCSRSSRSS